MIQAGNRNFAQALQIKPGITSVIGGGGKSTLLEVLAAELAPATVILTTTTHMFPPASVPTLQTENILAVGDAVAEHRAICLGTRIGDGRLCSPGLSIARLTDLADYVIVEADGSRTLPLKAHAPHEPAIPFGSRWTVWVVGLSGLGRPIRESAHRPERFAALAGAEPDDPTRPEHVARVIFQENNCDIVLLNQVDIEGGPELADAVAEALDRPAVSGSLQGGYCKCLW